MKEGGERKGERKIRRTKLRRDKGIMEGERTKKGRKRGKEKMAWKERRKEK